MTHTATLCNTLQRTATHCIALQRTATHCNALHRTATHCNALQRTATHCNALQRTATHCNKLQHTTTHCNALQRPAPHYKFSCADAFAQHHGADSCEENKCGERKKVLMDHDIFGHFDNKHMNFPLSHLGRVFFSFFG